MQLSGARHQCSLFVDRVTRHMHGDWMCLLNEISQFNSGLQIQSRVVLQMKAIRSFVITEKAPTRAFSWLKAATTAFTFKTLLKHYAKRALTPRSLNVKLGPRRNHPKGRVAIRHYANQTARPS